MDTRKNVYGLNKTAIETAGAGGAVIGAAGDFYNMGAVYFLAALAMAGLGTGYAAAKITAHGPQDIATAKKQYENERLKADIGYLTAKTQEEAAKAANPTTVKPARVIA